MAKRGRKPKAESATAPKAERVSVLTDEEARRDQRDAALLSAVLRDMGREDKCALWGFATCLRGLMPMLSASGGAASPVPQ